MNCYDGKECTEGCLPFSGACSRLHIPDDAPTLHERKSRPGRREDHQDEDPPIHNEPTLVVPRRSLANHPDVKLPCDSRLRKDIPLARGVLDYFPLALVAVAELSRIGNDKHNPGEPIHWSKEKSDDHADCIVRHLMERGTVDRDDSVLHSTKVAWRALALLQIELEGG